MHVSPLLLLALPPTPRRPSPPGPRRTLCRRPTSSHLSLISLAGSKGPPCPPSKNLRGRAYGGPTLPTSAGRLYPALYLTLFLLQKFLSGCVVSSAAPSRLNKTCAFLSSAIRELEGTQELLCRRAPKVCAGPEEARHRRAALAGAPSYGKEGPRSRERPNCFYARLEGKKARTPRRS